MIIVGDLHLVNKEPYRKSKIELLDWLLNNYKDETIIFLGDLFDVNYIHSDLVYYTMDVLKHFKKVYLLTGNHDVLRYKRFGNILMPFEHFSNITVITDVEEIEIEGMRCLFLPYKNDHKKMKEYENLKGAYSKIFTHITPVEVAFGDEGIQLNFEGEYIHGHTHIYPQKSFIDTNNQKHFIIGVPLPTRNGEEKQEHKIFKIELNKKIEEIKVPEFMTIQTIKFGEEITNKNDIYNIIDAPDKKSVYEKYEGFYIRDEGIKFIDINGEESEKQRIKIGSLDMKSNFIEFAKTTDLAKAVQTKCLEYLD